MTRFSFMLGVLGAFFCLEAQAQPIIKMTQPGPVVRYDCTLAGKDTAEFTISGQFDPIPPDPDTERYFGEKQLTNHVQSSSAEFFDGQSKAIVNDLLGRLTTQGRKIEQDGIKRYHTLEIHLGDDGIGVGRLWSYSTPPADYPFDLRRTFVAKQNLAVGFCNHNIVRLRGT